MTDQQKRGRKPAKKDDNGHGLHDLPQKKLLRVDEAARYFDVTERTIYLWIEHGLLKAEKLNRIYRIPEQSIIEFRLAGRENAANRLK